VSILFWGDSFVPILGDLASMEAPRPDKFSCKNSSNLAGEDNVIDALIIALARNNITITPLEEFIAAESPSSYSQEIIVEFVPDPREP
jgi:hypothetical protein